MNAFREQASRAMYLRIEVTRSDSGTPETLAFPSSPVRIGRSPLNNVVLNSPWVSLHHGLLHFDESTVSYSDLGSTNGSLTVVPGGDTKKVVPMVPVVILGAAPGTAEVVIGNVTIRVSREGPASASSSAGEISVGKKRDLGTRLTATHSAQPENGPSTAQIAGVAPKPSAAATGSRATGVGPSPPGSAYEAGATRYVSDPDAVAELRASLRAAEAAAAGPVARPTGAGPASTPPVARPSSGSEPAYKPGLTRMVSDDEREQLMGLRAAAAAAANAAPEADAVPSAPLAVPGSDAISGRLDAYGAVVRIWARGPTGAPQIRGPDRVFAETLAAVADAFARGLVELKRGLQEFGEGIGVRAVSGQSPLHRSQSGADVLAYLIDPQGDTHERLEQLVDLFADMMIHEVALLNGVKAGVRRLLAELDPETVEGKANRGFFGLGGSMRRYAEHFRQIAEDDGQAIVLGRAFAKAYASALGEDREGGAGRRRG